MLGIGAFSCALVMAPVLQPARRGLRHRRADGGAPNALAAPQADADGSAVAKGMFGGELPWTMIGIGAGIGVALIVASTNG